MSEEQLHLEDAKKLYRKAFEEFEIAREKNDRIFLCGCLRKRLALCDRSYVCTRAQKRSKRRGVAQNRLGEKVYDAQICGEGA